MRIGYNRSREPTLPNLREVVQHHASTIAYESIDVLLGRPPRLDLESLQQKMVHGRRGGYCFENYISNLIAASPGPEGTRLTLFNDRLTIRDVEGNTARQILGSESDFVRVLTDKFGIHLSEADLQQALRTVAERGWRDGPHPFFA